MNPSLGVIFCRKINDDIIGLSVSSAALVIVASGQGWSVIGSYRLHKLDFIFKAYQYRSSSM
jgi:hypothetical protein